MQLSINPVRFMSNNFDEIYFEKNNEIIINKQTSGGLISDKKWKNGFFVGTLMGILAATGFSTYNTTDKTNELLKDMKKTLVTGNIDGIEISDMTKDNTPDIILKDENGDMDIYDIKSKKVYVKLDDEIIEKDI